MRFVPRVQVQGGDGQRKRGGKLGVTFEVGFEGGFYLVDPPCGRCTGGACLLYHTPSMEHVARTDTLDLT